MKVLLDAFANLMVALRFGSDSYARGKKDRALAAFQEALQLYSTTGARHRLNLLLMWVSIVAHINFNFHG